MRSNRFFQIVEDLDEFDFKGFNLFKLFYVSLVFRESGRRVSSTDSFFSSRILVWGIKRFIAFFRTLFAILRSGLLDSYKNRVIFYGASDRHVVIDGVKYDLYNASIIEQKGRSHFFIIEDRPSSTVKIYQPDLYLHDLAPLIGLLYLASYIFLGRDIKEYAHALTQRYPELGFSDNEIEKKVLLFYGKFFTYRFLLSLLKPERVLLIAHYGKEAFIAACQHSDVQVIELMHGSIIPSHPQYVFPKSYSDFFHRSLFPHRLAVYGEYWKQVVVQGNMFPEDSILVIGYYLKVPDASHSSQSLKRTTILITSQPTVQQELCRYVSFLKSRLNQTEWHIIVKPHPMESEDAYAALQTPNFVTVSHTNVYELLAECDIHVSVYSSVLYEALRYGVSNYVLYLEAARDHCEAIINSGVAQVLAPDQVPDPSCKPQVITEFYFADYDSSILFG